MGVFTEESYLIGEKCGLTVYPDGGEVCGKKAMYHNSIRRARFCCGLTPFLESCTVRKHASLII